MNIQYIDNHILVLVKPAGKLVQADETGDTDILTSIKSYLKKKYDKPGNVYLGLVHRLDRPVSGLMVLARTSKAAARLAQAFRNSKVSKRYIAIVEAVCNRKGTLEHYIYKKNRHVKIVPANHPKGKPARLTYQCISSQSKSLLDIDLETGRPHQIRVQLADINWPILGDFRYGATTPFDGRNLALHCYQLGFVHPVRKTWMQWRVPPPSSWNGYFDNDIQKFMNRNGGTT
jgi:RluA family pseudouridine synthase